MNTRLVGGVLLVGGVSVIAYYFLFSKKSKKKLEEDLLKKFESTINVDLSLAKQPVYVSPNFSSNSLLSLKEQQEIQSNIENMFQPKITIQPIDLTGLEKLGLGSVNWAEAIKKAG